MSQIASTDAFGDPKNETKIGTHLPGMSALKSVSGAPFFGHLLIWQDAGARRRRTDGGSLVGQRNVVHVGASRNN